MTAQVFQTPANFLQSCVLLVLLLALAHTEISSEVILDLFLAKPFQNMPWKLMIFVKGKFKKDIFYHEPGALSSPNSCYCQRELCFTLDFHA